jgi:ubiquitin C-terminal hydrolase
MEWTVIRIRGLGLSNTNSAKKCLNICYINSIIQCLANTAPFTQWLLNDDDHDICKHQLNMKVLTMERVKPG